MASAAIGKRALTTLLRATVRAGVAAYLSACSSVGGGLDYTGTPGQPQGALVFANLLLADISVDGVGGRRVVVDTGSPIIVLSPASFPGAAFPPGGTVDSLAFGGLTFHHPTVAAGTITTIPDPTVPIAGVVGCTLLCEFAVSLNYRDALVTLGPTATPLGADIPGAAISFAIQGGTAGFPASRIAITANIEGADHPFVVDSGSSFVQLRSSLFNQITSDGRAQVPVSTTSATVTTTTTAARLRSIAVAGAQVPDVVVNADPSLDSFIDGVAHEVGHPVDGVLGGTFLREFFVTIDYPRRTLHLQRYTTRDHIVDEFIRVGVTLALAAQGQGYPVVLVIPGTDAAQKGVAVGDSIVAIDGQALAPLGPVAASRLLSGPLGSAKMVEFGATQLAALSNQRVAVRVDEVLPP
jgi:Aspartyl protease